MLWLYLAVLGLGVVVEEGVEFLKALLLGLIKAMARNPRLPEAGKQTCHMTTYSYASIHSHNSLLASRNRAQREKLQDLPECGDSGNDTF